MSFQKILRVSFGQFGGSVLYTRKITPFRYHSVFRHGCQDSGPVAKAVRNDEVTAPASSVRRPPSNFASASWFPEAISSQVSNALDNELLITLDDRINSKLDLQSFGMKRTRRCYI